MFDVLRRRLPRSAVVWFVVAALAAAASMQLVRTRIERLEATRPDLGVPVEVVTAAVDLERGTALGVDALALEPMPASVVPPGAVRSPGEAVGRVLVTDLAAGEVLTATRLAGAGAGPIAGIVPPGLRAFVLPAGPPRGVVEPGDLIDVLATYGANGGRPYTDTVATGLEVVEIVETTSTVAGEASGGPPVVVLADPLTVESLARAASLGVLSVAVVGADDPPTSAPVP